MIRIRIVLMLGAVPALAMSLGIITGCSCNEIDNVRGWNTPRYDRCLTACHPYRVVSCESGATRCANGTVQWRREGEP